MNSSSFQSVQQFAGPVHQFAGLTRRELLQRSAVGFGSLALASMLTEENLANDQIQKGVYPLQKTHFPAHAKRVIFMFMKGGPSQVDTFDYKPQLQKDHGKPLPYDRPRVNFAQTGALLGSPWKFKQYGESGKFVSDLFPNVAQHVDDLCFLHSLHGTNSAHGGACLKMHTGSDSFIRPSLGSWVNYGLGSENQNLPGFITICPDLTHGGSKNWNSAFLPAQHSGVSLGNASVSSEHATVRYIKNQKLSSPKQRMQLDFLNELNREHLANIGPEASLEARTQSFELAFKMQTEMPEAIDLAAETEETHKLYGIDDPVTADYGRQCLMARRFSERGVRFIQITHANRKYQWDQHGSLKEEHPLNAKEVDKPIAGLLQDLKDRDLLKDTLLIWGGEFGRTPTVQGKERDGRDHNPEGFTMWLAGGGVKPGFSYGATDEYGYYAIENKIHLHDFHATLLYALGLDHEKLTFRYAGRDHRLTDVSGNIVHDIFA